MPMPLHFPALRPEVAAHAILCACGDLETAIDRAESHEEFMAVWAIVKDAWNQIEAVSRYAAAAANKDVA